jgi:hypothetical protein
MPISPTGEGLNILIACDYVPHHAWMSFLCWYSITKNLPDAKITVACHRRLMKHRLYDWTRQCKVPFVLHKADADQAQVALELKNASLPLLVVPPDTVCVRDFEESGFSPNVISEEKVYRLEDVGGLLCDCKEEKPCPFVRYTEGWGKFVTASWIHRLDCPFVSDRRYIYGSMTANELRIGKFWSAVTHLFQTVARG